MNVRNTVATVFLMLFSSIGWTASPQVNDSVLALGEYRIGPADVLQISVWKNESLTRTLPVRPDGMISLPLINEVRAAGLTPGQLRELLRERLSAYMPNPEISVIVEEVHSHSVSILGEVKKPGRFELKGRTTVLNVIAQAEGFSEFASKSNITILRQDGDKMKRIRFDYDEIVSNGKQQNVILQPGDIILVP